MVKPDTLLQTNVQQGEQRVSDAKGYIGHYGSECLSKATAVTQEVEISSEEEAFLGTVASKDNTSWSVNIRLQGIETGFKMDTGAEVTVISDEVYKSLSETRLE